MGLLDGILEAIGSMISDMVRICVGVVCVIVGIVLTAVSLVTCVLYLAGKSATGLFGLNPFLELIVSLVIVGGGIAAIWEDMKNST